MDPSGNGGRASVPSVDPSGNGGREPVPSGTVSGSKPSGNVTGTSTPVPGVCGVSGTEGILNPEDPAGSPEPGIVEPPPLPNGCIGGKMLPEPKSLPVVDGVDPPGSTVVSPCLNLWQKATVDTRWRSSNRWAAMRAHSPSPSRTSVNFALASARFSSSPKASATRASPKLARSLRSQIGPPSFSGSNSATFMYNRFASSNSSSPASRSLSNSRQPTRRCLSAAYT